MPRIALFPYRLLISLGLLLTFAGCDDLFNNTDDENGLKGTWEVKESSPEYGDQTYLVEITNELLDENFIRIYNFFGLGSWSYVNGEVNEQQLIIPIQEVEGFRFYGLGTIDSGFESIELRFVSEEIAVISKTAVEIDAVFTKN